ncbi:MAG: helix-turn-helix transcriptional regulator [Ktedonobacteraceae bacterium]|nr:helix-turn-helix transcriptional regulator [Ktedonobacteraceae bacterium]
MMVEENVPNERLRRARSLRGWTQAELAEEIGTCFEMVSRWERGITTPSIYFRERLCVALGKSAEELGLMQVHASLSTPLPTPLVFLASSHVDAGKKIFSRLKMVLQERGITLWSSRQLNRYAGERSRAKLREVIRATQAILVIGSPQARTSRHVKEVLEMARIYRRPVCDVWIEGEHWRECLPPGYAGASASIDARRRDDPALCEEVATALEKAGVAAGTPSITTQAEMETSCLMDELRNPSNDLQTFHGKDQSDLSGREALIGELTGALNSWLSSKQTDRLSVIMGPGGSSTVPADRLPHRPAGGVILVALVEIEKRG